MFTLVRTIFCGTGAKTDLSKATSTESDTYRHISKFGRHVVVDVSRHLSEIRLTLKNSLPSDDSTKSTLVCILRGSWINTQVAQGDIVNVLTDFSDLHDAYVIADLNGLLVVDPDKLISGTSIVSSLFCMRKSVLNEIFKGLDGSSKTMFIGTLVHELLQDCLLTRAQNAQQVHAVLKNLLCKKSILQDIVALRMSEQEVMQEVEPFLPHILHFTER